MTEGDTGTALVATPSRVHGAMLGLAVGDAIGAPFEFKSAELCTAAVESGLEMTGGGPWLPGEWTDDTAMALALAESLGKRRGFDVEDVANRYITWADSMPKDIGITTKAALVGSSGADDSRKRALRYHEATRKSAGNGTVMRATPLAFIGGTSAEIERMAREDALLTHHDPAAGLASAALCEALLSVAIGREPNEVVAAAEATLSEDARFAAAVRAAKDGDGATLADLAGAQMGACWTALGVGLFALSHFDDYESGVSWAVSLGGDTDTNAAVAGALLGCRFGVGGIPRRWRDALLESDRVLAAAAGLTRLPSPSVARSQILYGVDHEELGEVETVTVDERAAIGISRGRLQKSYGYMDLNEDVVGAFSGPGGTLVALADGHNGRDSAAIVIDYVAEHLGKEPGPRSLRSMVTNVIHAAGEAIQREASWKNARAPESRTTFAAAAAHGRDLAFATMGDSALFVCGHGGSRRLDDPKHHFVGYPMTKDEVRERLITGEETLGDGEWVVLVTDGFTDFPSGAVPRLGEQIDPQGSAEAAVRSLIEAAFEGGAGDNVAAAVICPRDAAIDPLTLRGALPSIEACFRDRFRHWGITLPAADVAERRPGHIFRAGWHIGYVWGDDENGIYLEYLSQHRMTSDSRQRIYESGHVAQIELPSTLVPYPDDPAERARINEESAREHREANSEMRDLGLLPPAGTNQPAIEINEHLRSREPEDGAG